MSLKVSLLKARGSLVFLIGLTLAFGTVFTLERWNPELARKEILAVQASVDLDVGLQIPPQITRELTTDELEYAKIAWRYFENNTNADTGLVNSVNNYPAATLWDTSSYLLGLISAYKLGIVGRVEFNERVSQLLVTLADIPLFDGDLPNKSYSTADASMVTYDNRTTERGIGWSAIDIGRVLVPFNVLVWRYPDFTADVNKVLANWNLYALVRGSEMVGTTVDEQGFTQFVQEGRLGYEEYASKSLMLSGMDLSQAYDYEAHFKYIDVSDVAVGTDLRSQAEFDAMNAVVSEPYVLDGLEFGWDRYSKSLAMAVYQAQHNRYEQTGILTAVSEDNIDEAPFFVYNAVIADGKPWLAITENGADASDFKSISTKTVFGLHSLFNTEYTQLLMNEIKSSYDSDVGWYSGIYESSGEINTAITANTNGIVLESLHHIAFGPLLRVGRAPQVVSLREE